MRIQWIILGTTSVLAIGFMAFLMIKLAMFEGHRPKRSPKKRPATAFIGSPLHGGTDRTEPQGASSQRAEVSAINLRRLLIRLAKAPQPARRNKIFERARARTDEFEPHLLDILGDEHDHLIIPAIQLAGAIDLTSAALGIMLLANADRIAVRVAAIEAKERLDPWTDTELATFLRESDPDVLSATLNLVVGRERRPIPELTALLSHEKAAIRTAAAEAIPVLPPGADLEALCKFAETSEGEPAWAAALALGRPGFSTTAEDCLVGLLSSDDWMLRKSALIALGNKGSELRNATVLLETVRDDEKRLHERVPALIAMEKTGTFRIAKLKNMVPHLHPVLKVYAARCLAAAGDRSAIPTLIDLLDIVESDKIQYDDFLFATTEANAILQEFSGEDLGAKSEPWRQWYRANPTVQPSRAQRPFPAFW